MNTEEARVAFISFRTVTRRFFMTAVVAIVVTAVIGILQFTLEKRLGHKLNAYLNVLFMLPCILAVLPVIYYFAETITKEREIRVFCSQCGKFINWRMNWRCGVCDAENNTAMSSFLGECARCKEAPHSIICPHCTRLNYLDDKKISINPARDASQKATPTAQPASPDEAHKDEIRQIERRKEIVRLNAELLKEEAVLDGIAKAKRKATKTIGETVEESFADYRDRTMAASTVERREIQRAEEQYRNDPEALSEFRDMIKAWKEENSI